MQINFTPKKLKEAKEYVQLLKNPIKLEELKKEKPKKVSTFKKIFNFLFK